MLHAIGQIVECYNSFIPVRSLAHNLRSSAINPKLSFSPGITARKGIDYDRCRRFPKKELVSDITNSPSTATPRITTITGWPPNSAIPLQRFGHIPSLCFQYVTLHTQPFP